MKYRSQRPSIISSASSAVVPQHTVTRKNIQLPKHVVAMSFWYEAEQYAPPATPKPHFKCETCHFTYLLEFRCSLSPTAKHVNKHAGSNANANALFTDFSATVCRYCAEEGHAGWLSKSVQQQHDAAQLAKDQRKEARLAKQTRNTYTPNEGLNEQLTPKYTQAFGKPADYTK